jgi:hypothetical protein
LKILLTAFGASFEFTGIVLVAAPELFPRLFEIRRSVQARLERWRRWVLLRLGRQRSRTVYAKAGGVTGGGSMSTRGYPSPGEAASLEERLDFLLEQAGKARERLDKLDDRVADLPRQWQEDIRAMMRSKPSSPGASRRSGTPTFASVSGGSASFSPASRSWPMRTSSRRVWRNSDDARQSHAGA